jgi:DNA-binding MarR family transcriptional regulator
MTTPVASFGLTLAYAERTLSATLRRHLAERDVVPETWYVLNLIATRGPAMPRPALAAELEAPPNPLRPDEVRELLARLDAEGLVEGGDELDLTAEGKALHQSLREYVAGAAARLLGRFPAEDVETTVRTLRAITQRAAEELVDAR